MGSRPKGRLQFIDFARGVVMVIMASIGTAGVPSVGLVLLAGVLAQQNAEILAGITLAQLISLGTPVVPAPLFLQR